MNSTLYPALVQNHAQLTYRAVAGWLDATPADDSPVTQKVLQKKITSSPALHDSIARAACARAKTFSAPRRSRRAHVRHAGGAAGDRSRRALGTASRDSQQAPRVLIEDFMIAANRKNRCLLFFEAKGFPSILPHCAHAKKLARALRNLAAARGTLPCRKPRMRKRWKIFLARAAKAIPITIRIYRYPSSNFLGPGLGEYAVAQPVGRLPNILRWPSQGTRIRPRPIAVIPTSSPNAWCWRQSPAQPPPIP